MVIASETIKFLLGMAITSINAFVLYTILSKGFPDASKDLIIGVVSASGTAQGIVLQYYFGSSSGSAAKDRKSPEPDQPGSVHATISAQVATDPKKGKGA